MLTNSNQYGISVGRYQMGGHQLSGTRNIGWAQPIIYYYLFKICVRNSSFSEFDQIVTCDQCNEMMMSLQCSVYVFRQNCTYAEYTKRRYLIIICIPHE